MSELNLEGVGVALITPFKDDLSVDYEALTKVIDHIIKGGCDYIVALGTTAETPALSVEERIKLTDNIKSTVGNRVPLVIGIGGNCTRRVCNELCKIDISGYSAVLSVTPFYNKPTQEGLFLHYKNIADVSPIPVILYNVPTRTGVNLTAETTLRLANYSTKICGIKEASGKLDQCENIIKNAPKGFSLISGDDATTCALMKLGAKGVISVLANAFPKCVKKLVSLCNNAPSNSSELYQKNLHQLIGPLFEDGNPAGIKAVLYHLGLIRNNLRLPLVPVSESVEKKIQQAIKNLSSEEN